MTDDAKPRGAGPRGSIFARKLREVAAGWNPRHVVMVVRAIMFQVRDGALESMPPSDLAWVARDAEAAQEALANRAEFLARTAAAITAVVAAVAAPVFSKAPLQWALTVSAVAIPGLLIAFSSYLSSEAFKRAATQVGALVKEVDDVRKRRASQSPPYRTGVRVDAPPLEAGEGEEQDPGVAQERDRKKKPR